MALILLCLVFLSDAIDVNGLACERWHKFSTMEFASSAGVNGLLDCRHCPRIIVSIKRDARIVEEKGNNMGDSWMVHVPGFGESFVHPNEYLEDRIISVVK